MDILKSSVGNGKYSATLKGAIVLAIPFLIQIGQNYGIPLTEANIMDVFQDVTLVIGAITFIYGFARKCYYWVVRYIIPIFKKY